LRSTSISRNPQDAQTKQLLVKLETILRDIEIQVGNLEKRVRALEGPMGN